MDAAEHARDLEEEAKKLFHGAGEWITAHKEASAVILAGTAAGAYFLYKRNQTAAGGPGIVPVATGGESTPAGGDASSVPAAVVTPTTPAAAGYTATDLQNAATAGYSQGVAYDPAKALQSAAVSATQSAGQTLADNCGKVTHCQGIFGCIGNFFTSAIGCVGQAAITIGTAVGATVLPSVQTATNALANYAPSLLGAGIGIPGLPKTPTSAAYTPTLGGYAPPPVPVVKPPTPASPVANTGIYTLV